MPQRVASKITAHREAQSRYVLTGGRERLHLDLRTALHDNGMRAGRAGGTRRWRRHKLRIWDWCFAGNRICICDLWDHHDFVWVHPAAARTPAEERTPNEAVRNTDSRSHTLVRRDEVRRHGNDARRAKGANHNDSVAVESRVSVESPMKSATMAHRVPVESVATPVTHGAGWRGRDEKKRNCQEGDRRCTAHYCSPPERVDLQINLPVNRGQDWSPWLRECGWFRWPSSRRASGLLQPPLSGPIQWCWFEQCQ
jgi:hypothetical protein